MQLDKNILLEQLDTLFPDNNQGMITPQRVRDFLRNVVDSVHVKSDDSIVSNPLFANVKDFGAVGDGSTNDFDAFQSAIDLGLNVYIPKGSFKVNGQLVLQEYQSLFGAIGGSQIIFGSHSSAVCIILADSSSVSGLTLSTTDTSKTLVKIEYDNTMIQNVVFDSGSGILVAYESGVTITKAQIVDCLFLGALNSAIKISRDNFIQTVVKGCLFVNNNESLSLHSWNIDVTDCKFNSSIAIRLYSDEVVANPVLKITDSEFIGIESSATIWNEVTTTATMLHFNSCRFKTTLVQLENLSSTMSFLGCVIDKLTIDNTESIVSVAFSECSFRELPSFVGGDCTLYYGMNMVLAGDAGIWLIKTNEL